MLDPRTPVPGYENFFVAYQFSGETSAIIDVGTRAGVRNVLQLINSDGDSVENISYIILTHIHLDHAGGAGTALGAMPNARVVVQSQGRPHLMNPERLWEGAMANLGEVVNQWGRLEPVPGNRIIEATDYMRLDLGDGKVLEIILTPGHAIHHLCVFEPSGGVLFTGDAAGVALGEVVRVATPAPFRLKAALASLDKMINLRPGKLCYPHAGCYDNAVERLTFYKEKLVSWHEIISSAARSGKSTVEIATLLREKDRSLDYLNHLDANEYKREYQALLSNVGGLLEAK